LMGVNLSRRRSIFAMLIRVCANAIAREAVAASCI
jgi:hypothetical protein